MSTIFSKIISGEIPAYKIAENDKFLAFLDIFPLAEGHTLVIPKVETDYFFDLSDDLLSEINLFARDVARKIEKAITCERIGVAIIGLEVPHAHVHLVPLNSVQDINFSREKLQISQERLAEIAESIRSAN